MMIKEKYLPLGTVVQLKNGKKRLVIVGYTAISPDTGKKMYDYIGCLYPEGILNSNKNIVFDHEQIEVVFFEGYSDNEDIEFKNKLKEIVKNYSSEENMNTEVDIPVIKANNDSENESSSSIETFEL